jgi:hypothetical protein
MRNPPAGLILGGVILFVFGMFATSAFFWKTEQPVLQHVASAARVPIPGKADVQLTAHTYGVYFGMLNPPTGRKMTVPRLNFWFTPLGGVPRPEYADLPDERESESRVEGFKTIQIGRLVVRTPGKYHVEVESPESVGSFSIGELPSPPSDEDRLMFTLIGIGIGVVTLALSGALVASGVKGLRRDKERMATRGSSGDDA